MKNEKDNRVTALRELNPDKKEIRLYCHSEMKEKKQGILNRLNERFETALRKLQEGLGKKGIIKKADKIHERIGRIKQKNTRVSNDYTINVIVDEEKHIATDIQWERNEKAQEKNDQSGCYCLRSSLIDWSEEKLWHTYIMLNEVAACFRCMKSELGMRPVYHQKTERVTAHLFITLIPYHLAHAIAVSAKRHNLSWESLRELLSNQHHVTLSMNTQVGEKLHERVTTKAAPQQQKVFDALGRKTTKTHKNKICSANLTD